MAKKEFDNTNRGALFKNDKRVDKQPHYRGNLNVGGTEYWISAWINTSKAGDKYMALQVDPKEDQPEKVAPEPAPADFDDKLPF